MKNLFKYSNLVVGSAAIALNLSVISPQAMAFQLTWTLNNANFLPDASEFASGSFVYDEDINTYTSVNIVTNNDASDNSFSGATYTTDDIDIANSNQTSLVLNTGNETLTLKFESDLTNGGGIIALNTGATAGTFSKEDVISPVISRKFLDGSVSAVPFEFSPTLGIVACLCWWGIPILKNKLN